MVYNCRIQQNSLKMLTEVIDKVSMFHSGSNDTSTKVFLFDILVSLMLENYIVCDVWTGGFLTPVQ